MLVLALVLVLGEFDGSVGHVIPRVVDVDEQDQQRSGSDDEQWFFWRAVYHTFSFPLNLIHSLIHQTWP